MDNDTQFLGALTRSKNTSKEIVDKCREEMCDLVQASKMESKIHRLARRALNFLNEGRKNIPCLSEYQPYACCDDRNLPHLIKPVILVHCLKAIDINI